MNNWSDNQLDPESQKRMVFMTAQYHEGWALDAIAASAAGVPLPIRTMPHPPEHWVYFIQTGNDGPIKIGYSADPKQRFVTLQTGSSVDHHYLGNMPGSRSTEREIQTLFQSQHIRGEWYAASPDLLTYIELNRFRPDSDWAPEYEEVALW